MAFEEPVTVFDEVTVHFGPIPFRTRAFRAIRHFFAPFRSLAARSFRFMFITIPTNFLLPFIRFVQFLFSSKKLKQLLAKDCESMQNISFAQNSKKYRNFLWRFCPKLLIKVYFGLFSQEALLLKILNEASVISQVSVDLIYYTPFFIFDFCCKRFPMFYLWS